MNYKKIGIIVLAVCILAGVLYVSVPVIVLIGCMIVDDSKGMIDAETITTYVMDNREELEKVANMLLSQADELDVVIREHSCNSEITPIE